MVHSPELLRIERNFKARPVFSRVHSPNHTVYALCHGPVDEIHPDRQFLHGGFDTAAQEILRIRLQEEFLRIEKTAFGIRIFDPERQFSREDIVPFLFQRDEIHGGIGVDPLMALDGKSAGSEFKISIEDHILRKRHARGKNQSEKRDRAFHANSCSPVVRVVQKSYTPVSKPT